MKSVTPTAMTQNHIPFVAYEEKTRKLLKLDTFIRLRIREIFIDLRLFYEVFR